MNSGCYGSDISQALHSIKIIDTHGKEKNILASDIKFNYRSSSLDDNSIITSARLYGSLGNRDEIQKKQKSLIEEKKNAQPSQIKTGGSTFKNTLNKKAWKLIEESNCQKFQVGSAKMSEKHYNFFVNDGNTTAKELEDLINKVKDEVHKKTKINLELEIKIIGYNN